MSALPPVLPPAPASLPPAPAAVPAAAAAPGPVVVISKQSKPLPPRSARWCFTWNNPPSEQPWTSCPSGVRLLAYQVERGAEGTKHIQGYIAFSSARTFSSVKRFLGSDTIHVEIAQSNEQKCVDYCTKEDTRVSGPYIYGELAKPGQRTELQEAAAVLLRSGKLSEVDPALLLKYPNGCKLLASRYVPPLREPIPIITIIGPTDIGKTFQFFFGNMRIEDHFPYRPVYGNSGLWGDGYTDQPVFCFDEFKGQLPLSKLLPMLDYYPSQIEIKGGVTPARWRCVVILSNHHPNEWYPGQTDNSQFQALLRRLDQRSPKYMVLPDHPDNINKLPDEDRMRIINASRTDLADRCLKLRALLPGVFPPLPAAGAPAPPVPAPADQPTAPPPSMLPPVSTTPVPVPAPLPVPVSTTQLATPTNASVAPQFNEPREPHFPDDFDPAVSDDESPAPPTKRRLLSALSDLSCNHVGDDPLQMVVEPHRNFVNTHLALHVIDLTHDSDEEDQQAPSDE